jgi:hypothetical protein
MPRRAYPRIHSLAVRLIQHQDGNNPSRRKA